MRYSHELFLTELGQRMRKMRKERGLTLRDMIASHGFHLSHWQGLEKGKGVAVASLLRVCEAFDVSLETLIAGIGLVEEVASPQPVEEKTVEPGQPSSKKTNVKSVHRTGEPKAPPSPAATRLHGRPRTQ